MERCTKNAQNLSEYITFAKVEKFVMKANRGEVEKGQRQCCQVEAKERKKAL